MNAVVGWAASASIFVLVVTLSGCAGVTLEQIAREDQVDPARYTQLEGGGGVVRVYRDGRPLDARRGMQLQPGDEIETGAGGTAVIRFADQGEVVLAADTRVRVGSLEVLFGRVFANVRGLFTASSENVVAGVEGTGFMFEVGRDRSVRVVVLDGVVSCRSRTGSWPTIRLRARQALTSPYPNRVQPRVEQASVQQIEEIRQWVREVTSALPPPVSGWCCAGGHVSQTTRETCAAGRFYSDRAAAMRACASPPPITGWCCAGGRVTQTIQGRCAGKFYPNRVDAERACVRPPEPTGWCCAGGNVTYGRRDTCRGSFSTNKASADKACRPVIERIPEREYMREPQSPTPAIR